MSATGSYIIYNTDLDKFMDLNLSWVEESDHASVFPTLSYIRNCISLMKKRPPRSLGDINWEHCVIIPMTYEDDDYTIHYDAEEAC